MKSSAKRFLPLIPMIIWVFIWVGIAAGASFGYSSTHKDLAPGENKLWLIALVDIIALFDIAWYLVTCTRNTETGIINKIGNLIILDFPALLMINHWYKIKKQAEAKVNEKNNSYVKKTDADEKDIEEYDVTLTDWEREILKKKNAKKYEKVVKEDRAEAIVNTKIQQERNMIRGFSVYVMYNIYKKDPKIVNTYNIIQQYNSMVEDEASRTNLINSFIKMPKLGSFIENYDAKIMTSKAISDVLTVTSPAEYQVAFKQDRVQIMIDAKDNYFARNKKSSNKKSTK